MRSVVQLCLALSLLLVARSSSAQSPAAEALFRAGREALERGDFERGCALFQESERLEPSVGAELNLAACAERTGHFVRAWQMFRDIEAVLPREDARSSLAGERARALEQKIGHVLLTAATPLPKATRITIDRQSLTTTSLGVKIPLDPGRHAVEVESEGRSPRRYSVDVTPRTLTTLALEPGAPLLEVGPVVEGRTPTEGSAPRAFNGPPPARKPPTKGWSSALPVLALGASAAALTVSGIAGLGVLREKENVRAECNASLECSPAGVAAADRGNMLADLGTASFVVGLLLGGVGVTLFVLESRATDESDRGYASNVEVKVGLGHLSADCDF